MIRSLFLTLLLCGAASAQQHERRQLQNPAAQPGADQSAGKQTGGGSGRNQRRIEEQVNAVRAALESSQAAQAGLSGRLRQIEARLERGNGGPHDQGEARGPEESPTERFSRLLPSFGGIVAFGLPMLIFSLMTGLLAGRYAARRICRRAGFW